MDDEMLKQLEKVGAYLSGHFELSSGRHSGHYLQYALLLQYPKMTEEACKKLADHFRRDKATVVVGPAIGGIIVSFEVARQLGARSLFAERENGMLRLRRNFKIQKGEKVLVIEDVVTTVESVRELMRLVRSEGGEVIGVGALADRSGGRAQYGVPFKALLEVPIDSFQKEECPFCKQGVPFTKPGSKPL